MNLLTRYIIIELLKVFSVTLIVMTSLMLLIGVVQEAIQQNLTPLTILELIPFLLPNSVFFAMPGTILFSVCTVYARMSAGNEIIAIKSLGLSPMHVVWPALFIAFLLSLATVVLNDVAVSWGKRGVYRVILHSVEKTIYAVLNAEHRYDNGRLSMTVEKVDGKDLYSLFVKKYGDENGAAFELEAEQARLTCDSENNKLLIWIRNGTLSFSNQTTVEIAEKVIPINLEDATKKDNQGPRISNLPMWRVPDAMERTRKESRRTRQQLAAAAAFQMLGGDLVGLADPGWKQWVDQTRHFASQEHRLQAEPWRRWANGFSCLCFVLIGAPLAIRLQKADFWVVFFWCFLPVTLAYYPLLMVGIDKAKSGDWPPFAVWLANTVTILVGVVLLRRMLRH